MSVRQPVSPTSPTTSTTSICLTGWAYRHYNSADLADYWDEVLVTGNPPATDNADPFGTPNPTFMPMMDLEGFESDNMQAPFHRDDA